MSQELPERGFIMWPVGNGDSTTIVVDNNITLQLDLNHTSGGEEDDDPKTPVIDELESLLPKFNNRPYLAVFALTHPDLDHCRGFTKLLERVNIGELWFTPRVFREYKKDLSDDALAFRKEAERRVAATIENQGDTPSGDRVRLIGYDQLLQEDEFTGFPQDRLTVPGHIITELDGTDCGKIFRAFIHAPFKDDADNDRNDTSLAMQVTLWTERGLGSMLFFGDLKYPTLKRIFDRSEAKNLYWNGLLSPHHCSKSAFYWQDEGDDEEVLKSGLLDQMAAAAGTTGYVFASSQPFPNNNEPGDDPPHLIARDRYIEIAPDGFLCTGEHGDESRPDPIVIAVTESGIEYDGDTSLIIANDFDTLGDAVQGARGQNQPPENPVGFGIVT